MNPQMTQKDTDFSKKDEQNYAIIGVAVSWKQFIRGRWKENFRYWVFRMNGKHETELQKAKSWSTWPMMAGCLTALGLSPLASLPQAPWMR